MRHVLGFLRFCGFSVVRAWQGFWRNAMMSLAATATVILMLVLLSGLFIVLTGLNSGIDFIERKVGVTAELVDNLPVADRDALVAMARDLPGVTAVDYISPEAAMDASGPRSRSVARRSTSPGRTSSSRPRSRSRCVTRRRPSR